MTHREELQERYEDALFALLMEEMAEQNGEEYEQENELLRDEPSFAIPERADRRALRTIERAFTIRSLRDTGRAAAKLFTKVSVAVVVMILLGSTAFAFSPALRANTLNLIIDVSEKYTEFRFGPSDGGEFIAPTISVGWVPEGFELTQDSHFGDGGWIKYEKEDGTVFTVAAEANQTMVSSIDTENATIKEIEIHGYTGMLAINEDIEFATIIWFDDEYNCLVTITSEGLDQATMLHIAEETELQW